MARADKTERVERLTRKAKERSEVSRAAAQRAILSLKNRGLPVSIKTVAAEARVSESYLAKNFALREQIRALADVSRRSAPPAPSASTLASSRTKMLVMADRVHELEHELQGLRDENAALRGEILDLRRAARRRGSG